MTFTKHYTEAQILFEERNQILRWKLKADLSGFGGKGIEVEPRIIPIIINPYDGIDWQIAGYRSKKIEKASDGNFPDLYTRPPKIRSIDVDNYQGTIAVTACFANRIDWIYEDKVVKTKFNCAGKLAVQFNVEDLQESKLRFILTGDGGQISSDEFLLMRTA